MVFWQIVIGLSAVAALFVLWPLIQLPFLHKSWAHRASRDATQADLYKEHLADLEASLSRGDVSQEQFEALKLELQKTLLEEERGGSGFSLQRGGKKAVLFMALLIPVLGLILYNQLGAKPDWEIYQDLQELGKAGSAQEHQKQLRALSLKAQARLNQTSDNQALRNLLAQTSMALQDYDQAVDHYRAILDAFPENPRVMASLAQALFYRAGNTITPEGREYIQQSLTLAPMMPEMLGLAGIDAKNQGDFRGAIRHWKLAVSQMDPNSQAARGYINGIRKAEQALIASGESLDEPEKPAASEPKAASDFIEVAVSLGDDVPLSGNEVVFVYARAWQGPKVPLAISKLQAKDLPKTIRLDASMAMAPGMTIEQFDELELVARVSMSGDPAAKSGDWQADLGPLKREDRGTPQVLLINKQVP